MISKKTTMESIELEIGHIDHSSSFSTETITSSSMTFRKFSFNLSDSKKYECSTKSEKEIKCPYCFEKFKISYGTCSHYIMSAKEENREIIDEFVIKKSLIPPFVVGLCSIMVFLIVWLIFEVSFLISLLSVVIIPTVLAFVIAILNGKFTVNKAIKANSKFLIPAHYGNIYERNMDGGPFNIINHVEISHAKHGIVVSGTSGKVVQVGNTSISSSSEILVNETKFDLTDILDSSYELYFFEE